MTHTLRRSIALLPLAAVPLLVAGGALAAKVTTRSEVTALPAAAAGTAIAGCPPGAKATGGGARPSSPDDYLTGSAPVAKREWLAAGWGGEGNAFTAYARCVGSADLMTRSRTAVLPSGGEGAAVTARCPRGTQVAGGGARLGDDYEDYLIGSHPSGRRAWTAVGWRPGYPTPSTVTAFARCLKGAKLTTRRRTTPVPPANELRAARARCPRGTKSTRGRVQARDPRRRLRARLLSRRRARVGCEGLARGGRSRVIEPDGVRPLPQALAGPAGHESVALAGPSEAGTAPASLLQSGDRRKEVVRS